MKKRFMGLVLILMGGLLLTSCSERSGETVVLKEFSPGTIIQTLDESEVRNENIEEMKNIAYSIEGGKATRLTANLKKVQDGKMEDLLKMEDLNLEKNENLFISIRSNKIKIYGFKGENFDDSEANELLDFTYEENPKKDIGYAYKIENKINLKDGESKRVFFYLTEEDGDVPVPDMDSENIEEILKSYPDLRGIILELGLGEETK